MTHSPEVEVPFEGDNVVNDYITKYSNWGRWGADDELGTLNHVGPEQVVAAAQLVRQGRVISMTLPYNLRGPQTGDIRANPLNVMTATGTDYMMGAQDVLPAGFGDAKGFGYSDDVLLMPNQAGSQWDALAHIFWRGRMYNGYSADAVTAQGAQRCGIEKHRETFVMRGVLLDVARHRGVNALEPGYAITVDDLDRTAESQGVEVRKGDCVIVRTGMLEARRGQWGDYNGGPAPGLSLHTVPWLYEHDVAAIATDTWGAEVRPNEVDLFQPLHIVALVYMGIPFGEIWDLEAIGNDCAEDGIYEFLLSAAAARRIILAGQGQDGANGRASVTVVANLSAHGAKTRVDLETDLKLTGKPAQFGRGVMADVGDRLIGQFADALAIQLAADKLAVPDGIESASGHGESGAGPTEPLDLLAAASHVVARRSAMVAIPLLVVLLLLATGLRLRRRWSPSTQRSIEP